VRLLCWFSCGATSAVATKLALSDWQGETVVAYCDTGGGGSRNTGDYSRCCMNNAYRGCPFPLPIFDEGIAKQRRKDGFRSVSK
jgi:hypothetical protein